MIRRGRGGLSGAEVIQAGQRWSKRGGCFVRVPRVRWFCVDFVGLGAELET